MVWRQSLPARVAMTATGFLAAVILALTLMTYAVTALVIRQGLDQALLTALPLTANNYAELREHALKLEEEVLEHRHLRILKPDGAVLFGDPSVPVAVRAVARAMEEGQAFASRAERHVRSGPDWWQALTPAEHEVRLLYAVWGRRGSEVILELAAPVGEATEALPHLLGWMAVLGAGALLLSGLVTWRMAAAIYAPLRVVTAAARGISTATLARRVPDQWGDHTLAQLCGVLNQMLAQLQEAFETQGRFVAAAAHELRGPLSAMRAQLEVPLRRERTQAEYQHALTKALDETVRLGALAEHLLVLARYERGAGLAREAGLPLAPLLERAASEVRRSADAEVQVDAPESLTLDGDPIALERMVVNLVRNGIEAGGAPVRVTARPRGQGVEITVADSGRGIDPETLPHIFEPFFRADPARGRDRGTGLGLAIVKAVVEAHGGTVQVTSEPASGTTVTVWLPH